MKGILVALAGVLILSPDALCVRLLDMDQWSLQFYRGIGVAFSLFLTLAVTGERGRGVLEKLRSIGMNGLMAALCFSACSLLFVASLYLTPVANTLVIISVAPVFGVVFSRILTGELLPQRTWISALLTMGCIGFIFAHSGEYHGRFLGDVLALLQAMFMAATFVLVRRSPNVSMVPCMALSGLITACLALPFAGSPFPDPPKIPLLVLLCFFILPTSFAMLIVAPRYISAPEVNMIMLLEMILGPLLVWSILGEAVPATTLLGGAMLALVLAAHSVLALRDGRSASATEDGSRTALVFPGGTRGRGG